MMFGSLMLTTAMYLPIGGRKEIVSSMQGEANQITYFSQKTADFSAIG